jgi:hypothetical protein
VKGARGKTPTAVEMLLARVTDTETGYPADLRAVEGLYGGRVVEETLDFDGPDAKGAGGYYYADAPEAPGHPSGNEFAGGPLRKVIVFRLREVQPS